MALSLRWRQARSSRWSAATAPAKPPCCARSPACSRSRGGSIRFDGQPIHRRAAASCGSRSASRRCRKAGRYSRRCRSRTISGSAPGRARMPISRPTSTGVYATFPVLREKRAVPAGGLSGGQQQMLAIGRALMARRKLMLLDEPSMGLAPIMVDQIFAIIAGLQAARHHRAAGRAECLRRARHRRPRLCDRNRAHRRSRARAGAIAQDPRVREAYLGL